MRRKIVWDKSILLGLFFFYSLFWGAFITVFLFIVATKYRKYYDDFSAIGRLFTLELSSYSVYPYYDTHFEIFIGLFLIFALFMIWHPVTGRISLLYRSFYFFVIQTMVGLFFTLCLTMNIGSMHITSRLMYPHENTASGHVIHWIFAFLGAIFCISIVVKIIITARRFQKKVFSKSFKS